MERLTWSFFKDNLEPTTLGHFNRCPEGLTEIGEEQFMSNLFYYSFARMELRQVRQGINFRLRMFPLSRYDRANMGFAILEEWRDLETSERLNKSRFRYMRYGKEEEWNAFTKLFNSQFKGDNS